MTRDQAVAFVAGHGWVVGRTTRRGYLVMRCACGSHQETLHKTPAVASHFAQKAKRMVATCSREVR